MGHRLVKKTGKQRNGCAAAAHEEEDYITAALVVTTEKDARHAI
jgi:hypothetical protein